MPQPLTPEQLRAVQQAAQDHEPQIVQFLRDIIAIPSESSQEKAVVERIAREMREVGFDEVTVDPMGNLLGRIGSGPRVIAIDTHVDTVGVGNREEWPRDPYAAELADGVIYGRGASDQKGPMASMVYAGKIIQQLGLHDEYTLYMVASVQEEDCDGLCWQYIVNEDGIRPEVVVITEPTNLGVYRGHRGRMEIGVTTRGVSCHASAPERGDNAIYKMTPIIREIEALNARLREDDFLGKGTIAVTYIECDTPSFNAVPPRCYIHLDRRLSRGETKEVAVHEVEEAVRRAGVEAKVHVPRYAQPSHTGLVYETEKYFPTWALE